MELQYREIDNRIRLIKLSGNLDLNGVGQIESRFTGYCSGDNVRVILDVSEVDFLSSIGIRLLLVNAKSVSSRGGKMVLLAPTPDVETALELTGLLPIIPIYNSVDSAQAALLE
jgi:anti-sigma B factor antagonist